MALETIPRHANYCSECGHKFGQEDEDGIHYKCKNCNHYSGNNPRSVNIVLQPVIRLDSQLSLLTGKRAVREDGGFGKFALPAGWHDTGEEVAEGAVRELREEHGLVVDPDGLSLLQVITGHQLDKVCFFWLAPNIMEQQLPEFVASREVSEQKLITADETSILAFDGHKHFARQFFNGLRTCNLKDIGKTLNRLSS